MKKNLSLEKKGYIISGALFGAVAGSPSIQAAQPAPEIGGEYQINVTHSNDGLNDKDLGSQYPTTSFNLKGVKFSFKGRFSEDIEWYLLYKAKESELERFYLTHKVSDNLSLVVGKQKIKVYGLHRKLTSGVTTPILSPHLDQNPLKDKLSLDISYKLFGTASLQLVEDYSKCTDDKNTCSTFNRGSSSGIVTNSKETQTTQKQPAFAFEWIGSFGDWSPLAQYSVYDLGNSNVASAGLRFKNDSIDSYLDVTMDTRNLKGVDPTDPTRHIKLKNTYSGAVLYAEGKVARYTPFVHISNYKSKPYEKPGATDKEKTALKANSQGKTDNNAVYLGIGTHYDGWGAFYRPFVSALVASGDFVDPKDDTKTKKLSKIDVSFGIIGKM